MTWNELISQCASQNNLSRANAQKFLSKSFEIIAQTVNEGERVIVAQFGVFYPATRKSRRVRHPHTKELIMLPSVQSIGFRTAKSIKR